MSMDHAALASATGLGRAFSGLKDLQVKVQPGATPCFIPTQDGVSTPTVQLPALPTSRLDAETLGKLRAYLYHEMLGEARRNEWHDELKRRGKRDNARLAALCNGIGDAILDNAVGEARPGAGTVIKAQVRRDLEETFARGSEVEPSVSALAAILRYIGEGLTTRSEAEKRLPKLRPLLRTCAPEIDHLELEDQKAMVDQAIRILELADEAAEEQSGSEDGDAGEGASGEAQGAAGSAGSAEAGSEAGSEAGEAGASGEASAAGSGSSSDDGDDGLPLEAGGSGSETTEERLQREIGRALEDAAQSGDSEAINFSVREPSGGGRAVDASPLEVDSALVASLSARLKAVLQGHTTTEHAHQKRGRVTAGGRDLHRAGIDGRIFSRSRPGRDTSAAVALALDRSSSMNRDVGTGSDVPSRLEITREVAAAWLEACNRMEVETAAASFSTGRASWLKRIGEPVDRALRHLARLTPGGGTQSYTALHPLVNELARSEADHKVLVMISDGETRAKAKQWKVLRAAERLGIGVVALGIGVKNDPSSAERHGNPSNWTFPWPRGGQFGHRWIYVERATQLKRSVGRALQRVLRESLRG